MPPLELFFEVKSEKTEAERLAYEKRMASLVRKQQEREYNGMTSNVKVLNRSGNSVKTIKTKTSSGGNGSGTGGAVGAGEVSLKNSTAIGLNMIVAPVAFGVFLYHFAGAFLKIEDSPTTQINTSQNIYGMLQ